MFVCYSKFISTPGTLKSMPDYGWNKTLGKRRRRFAPYVDMRCFSEFPGPFYDHRDR